MKKEAERFSASNIFEGMVSLRSVIKAQQQGISDRKIKRVYIAESKIKKRSKELSYIKALSYELGYEMISPVPDEKIAEMAIGTSHGGIIFETTDRTIPALDTLKPTENGFYVMIDGIEDPYNFGYCLRSLYAAGASAVILAKRNWMSAAGVVCRASAGASEQFSMYTADSLEAIEFFKNHSYTIICADKENSVSAYECDMKFPIFLLVGGEKRGISSPVLEKADKIVRLDYARDFPAALSAASAASILAFEIMRQNNIK